MLNAKQIAQNKNKALNKYLIALRKDAENDPELLKAMLDTDVEAFEKLLKLQYSILHDLNQNGYSRKYNYVSFLKELQDNLLLIESHEKHKILRSSVEHAISRVQMQKYKKPNKHLVTIYGSARNEAIEKHSQETGYEWQDEAIKFSQLLAGNGFDVITGGGPGFMECGNKGVYIYREKSGDYSVETFGLNIFLDKEEAPNNYQTRSLYFTFFFNRKTIFIDYSSAFIAFPGGFGTLDELLEVLTLIQTKKIKKRPVILIDPMKNSQICEYWQVVIQNMTDQLAKMGYINKSDQNLFEFATPKRAVKLIKKHIETVG